MSTTNSKPIVPKDSVTQPLAAMVPLQRVRIPVSYEHAPKAPAVVTPTDTNVVHHETKICGTQEKVGRWTEEEHKVFLEGLSAHGKQWKTIAEMIGTRTVVQVRTHAQKYFQKLERSKHKSSSRSTLQRSTPVQKRKSVPTPAGTSGTKKSKRIHARMSKIHDDKETLLIPDATVSLQKPQQVISYPSSIPTGHETWSSEAPSGIEVEDVEFDEAQLALDLLVDEPLEWLIENTAHHFMPEASLPSLPYDTTEDATVVSDNVVDEALRSNLVDANLTMHSLLSLEYEEN